MALLPHFGQNTLDERSFEIHAAVQQVLKNWTSRGDQATFLGPQEKTKRSYHSTSVRQRAAALGEVIQRDFTCTACACNRDHLSLPDPEFPCRDGCENRYVRNQKVFGPGRNDHCFRVGRLTRPHFPDN